MDRLLAATRAVERDHFWFRGFRRFVTPLVADAVAGRSAPRLLDCGCGTGWNLGLLGRYGTAYGVDLTWSGLAAARSAGQRQIAQATAASLPFRSASVDVATSFDVLYLLPDAAERAAIAEMHRVLVPGGVAIVNVAAMPILHGHHSVLSAELRRYTRPMLRRRLEAAGFSVERITHTNAVLFPMMLAARAAQRLSGARAEESDIRMPAAWVNQTLSAALAVEAGLVRRIPMPFGSSLLAVARKARD
jgi:SAM-dependent methyltransferase